MSKNMEYQLSFVYLGKGREDDEDGEKSIQRYSRELGWKDILRLGYKAFRFCVLKFQIF